jgi:hypothetical protein
MKNLISAWVVADSLSPTGKRLVTFALKYNRWIHSELMTHREFSRNAASSRAIPVAKTIKQVWNTPAIPVWLGKNQPGMSAKEELGGFKRWLTLLLWCTAGKFACVLAKIFELIGVHKQFANRLLEPWVYIETLVTSTEWGNFYNLRLAPDAQPEFRDLAQKMLDAQNISTPVKLKYGQWHLPFVSGLEIATHSVEDCIKFSVARCARVSTLHHDGTPTYTADGEKRDRELHDRLMRDGHVSPFEHQATPSLSATKRSGNFIGWKQYRKTLKCEYRPICPSLLDK